MNFKNWKGIYYKFVGTGSSSYEKRIYRAVVSQRLRNPALEYLPNVVVTSGVLVVRRKTHIRGHFKKPSLTGGRSLLQESFILE